MNDNDFQPGEVYEFKRADYIPTRETGKLVFLLKGADGEPVGRTVPFDFQMNDYPEVLTVICRGGGKFDQTLESVLPQVYTPGKTYTFKIWREGNGTQGFLLRDEVNGLTHSNVRMAGAGGLKRFAEIDCRVEDITPEGLQLSYCGAKMMNRGGYTLQTLCNNDRLSGEPWMRVAKRVMGSEMLAEAREAAERGDGRWVSMALQTLVRIIPQWLSEGMPGRRVWVKRLNHTIRTVVESSTYAASFNYDKAQLRQQRHELTRGLEQLEYIDTATRLIAQGEAENMINDTLETMRRSGWVFEPNKRMGVLMQVLALNPGLAHSHTGDVFEIIRTRRSNRDFMSIFGDAFKIMLKTYIESERSAPDPLVRGTLRELAEAIAIELLLLESEEHSEEEFELWDTHRGTLYTVAALLTGHSGEAPVRKALLTYCGLNDSPLEFSWDDLNDINRVCYRLLATGHEGAVNTDVETVFEGESMRLRVDSRYLTLQPAADNLHVHNELTGPLATDVKFMVQLPETLKEKGNLESENLELQRQLWQQVRLGLEQTESTRVENKVERDLQPGDVIPVIVAGIAPNEYYEYDVRSVDGRYSGLMNLRDVVPYPVVFTAYKKIFYGPGGPLRVEAVAESRLPDGRWRFSMRRFFMEVNNDDACQDRFGGNRVIAKISDVSGTQYKATSQFGYGMLISKRDTEIELHLGDVVEVKVNSVNYKPEDWKLYVNCDFIQLFTDDENDPDVADALNMTHAEYGSMVAGDILRETFPCAEQYEVATLMPEEEHEVQETRYLTADAVSNIAFLLEQCAALQRADLRNSYMLLNLAQLLADMSGDRARSDQLGVQLRLLEAMSRFAIDGMMQLEQVQTLIERGRRLAPASALLRSRLKEVAILASLDNRGFLNRNQEWLTRGADGHIHSLMQLATAYNALEGLGAADIRDAIRKRIHTTLSLPTVVSKQRRLNVSEDLYHEFKTSAVFPADNHMQPDEQIQGFVIARTVASLLNTDGGTIYLGVDNGGNVVGLDNDFRYLNKTPSGKYDIRETQDRYNLYLQKVLRRYFGTTVDGLSLVPDYVDIQYEEVDGRWICHINVVPFGTAVLTKPDDRLFIRKIGSTEEIRDPKEKERFIERRNARI